MGLLDFLKKDRIENENKSKPFYANASNAERRDWFSRTRPWHEVDTGIIDALISKCGDNPMSELFVITSMERGLVPEYEELGRKGIDPVVACSVISGILFMHGAAPSAQVGKMLSAGNANERNLSKLYGDAMGLLESSVIIDQNQIGAYVQLAGLRGMVNRKDDALKFVRQGLEAINRIRESNVPFHKSNIPDVQNAAQHFADTERMLLAMAREFE
jgi:hypothetical protein